MSRNLTIILPEPDSYKDIVIIFERQLAKIWADCPYQIIWANEKEYLNSSIIKTLNCGTGNPTAFCGRIISGIKEAQTKYILIWVADMLPTKRIDSRDIEEVLLYMDVHGCNYCDLKKSSTKNMTKDSNTAYFYKMRPTSPYNISTGFCIFNSKYLISLIKDSNWTGWQLENYGMYLSSIGENNGCVYYDKNIGNMVHLMTKGKIIMSNKKKLLQNGVNLDGLNREQLSIKSQFLGWVKYKLGVACPVKIRKNMKKALSLIGIKFESQY